MSIDVNHENLLEWITGDKTIACTLSQRKHVNLFRKLSEKYPEDYRLIAENEDGSIYGEVSINCISFRSPSRLTDEQRVERAEQAKKNWGLT
jgi:hypothetical protein